MSDIAKSVNASVLVEDNRNNYTVNTIFFCKITSYLYCGSYFSNNTDLSPLKAMGPLRQEIE